LDYRGCPEEIFLGVMVTHTIPAVGTHAP
jgi:hypothetical protein